MPTRSIDIDGRSWLVFPSGRVTQYDRDEFGLIFIHGVGADRQVRVTRYSPQGSRSREESLVEMSHECGEPTALWSVWAATRSAASTRLAA